MQNDLEAKIYKLIEDVLAVDAELITNDASFNEDLYADSLCRIELALETEDIFDISVSNEEADECVTVLDWVKMVRTKVAS